MSSDRYLSLANTSVGKLIAGNVGLPVPTPIERYSPGDPVARGTVLLGAAPGGRLSPAVAKTVADVDAKAASAVEDPARRALADAGVDAAVWTADAAGEESFGALVFDASGIAGPEDLAEVHAFFQPTIRRVRPSGRVIVLGTPPDACAEAGAAVAQRALEGFTRSVGKEIRRGSTAQLVYVEPGAEGNVDSTIRFLLSARSAFVSGQVVRVGPGDAPRPEDPERPLDGRTALVTGASRGIGGAIVDVLARGGAQVVGLDVPGLSEDLDRRMQEVGGTPLVLDITDPRAPDAISSQLQREHGGADIVIHNAGITRDKTLGRMDADVWEAVLEVNLVAPARITEKLLATKGALAANPRIVLMSSMNGIAGQGGQTNYATSKAGLIGLVHALDGTLRERGGTISAVAPGFIETEMTARMPFATREAGRRMNALSQGGQPVDVAETVAWLAEPGSGGLSGNVVRVCGQHLLGA